MKTSTIFLVLIFFCIFTFTPLTFADGVGTTTDMRYIEQYFDITFSDIITEHEFAYALENINGVIILDIHSHDPIGYEKAINCCSAIRGS